LNNVLQLLSELGFVGLKDYRIKNRIRLSPESNVPFLSQVAFDAETLFP